MQKLDNMKMSFTFTHQNHYLHCYRLIFW